MHLSSLTMLIIKSIIGEHYYRCSDNYVKLIICMTLFIATAIFSSFFNNSYIKILVAFIGIVLTSIVYSKTVILLLKNLKQIKNKLFGKKLDNF